MDFKATALSILILVSLALLKVLSITSKQEIVYSNEYCMEQLEDGNKEIIQSPCLKVLSKISEHKHFNTEAVIDMIDVLTEARILQFLFLIRKTCPKNLEKILLSMMKKFGDDAVLMNYLKAYQNTLPGYASYKISRMHHLDRKAHMNRHAHDHHHRKPANKGIKADVEERQDHFRLTNRKTLKISEHHHLHKKRVFCLL